jgi:hypothetical protein
VQPVRGGGGFASRGHPELAEDVGDVHAGGAGRDEQFGGYVAVGEAGGYHLQHLLLAPGEPEGRGRAGNHTAAGAGERDSRPPGELGDLLLQRLSTELTGQDGRALEAAACFAAVPLAAAIASYSRDATPRLAASGAQNSRSICPSASRSTNATTRPCWSAAISTRRPSPQRPRSCATSGGTGAHAVT